MIIDPIELVTAHAPSSGRSSSLPLALPQGSRFAFVLDFASHDGLGIFPC